MKIWAAKLLSTMACETVSSNARVLTRTIPAGSKASYCSTKRGMEAKLVV